jgi:hypothetical protein
MSVTHDIPAGVEAYLAAVRANLSDLPATERDDLLAEVESSLREAAEEGGAVGARLGSPEEFASELRTAAGLHEAPSTQRSASLGEAIARIAADPRVDAARRVARELAPVWWVGRAYAVVAGIALLAGTRWSTRFPAVPRLGSAQAGVAAILVGAVASVAWGLWLRGAGGRTRRAAIAANIACVVLAVAALEHLSDSAVAPPTVIAVPEPFSQPGLTYNGAPVQNIYAYTVDGKLLHDVLLYDGAGNPLDVGASFPDPNRRILKTNANTSVFNSFPIRYYDPGTVRVAHPNAGPPVHTPHILPLP